MKHGPYEVVGVDWADDGTLPTEHTSWVVRDERTGRIGQVWRTEREAEIDLARILLRNMMHG